jgi:hypothetical protein
MPSRRKKTVWVVMHYEFTKLAREVFVDSVQFHVSSSRRRAEKYIRERWVCPYSWWQVHPHVVDDDEWLHNEGDEVYYYSHRGRPLRSPPFRQALKAYKREQDRVAKNHRKGKP